MKLLTALVLVLVATACVTPQQKRNPLEGVEYQLNVLEANQATLQRRIDLRNYRYDMERCGRSWICRSNTKILWERILEDSN